MDRVAKGGLAWCHLSQKPRPEGVVGTSLLKKNRKEEGVATLRESWKDVDLADKISGIKALEPILDPSVFVTAHASKGGKTVDWEGFDSIFGADNVYAWGKEQAGEPSHAMIWEWMHRNGLTQQQAADAIGISRRMLSYYLACAKPVPKTVWLACLGWEAGKQATASTRP